MLVRSYIVMHLYSEQWHPIFYYIFEIETSNKCRTRAPGHSFVLTTQNQNNQTKIVLIESLCGPLALASYWLTHINLTHFY